MSSQEVRTTSSTGGQKGVKPQRYDLLPKAALDRISEVYAFGAEKYADHNWRKGYEWSKSYAAVMRHLTAFWDGEDNDPESGCSHLGHAGFHIFTMLTFLQDHPDFDDRYTTVRDREAASGTQWFAGDSEWLKLLYDGLSPVSTDADGPETLKPPEAGLAQPWLDRRDEENTPPLGLIQFPEEYAAIQNRLQEDEDEAPSLEWLRAGKLPEEWQDVGYVDAEALPVPFQRVDLQPYIVGVNDAIKNYMSAGQHLTVPAFRTTWMCGLDSPPEEEEFPRVFWPNVRVFVVDSAGEATVTRAPYSEELQWAEERRLALTAPPTMTEALKRASKERYDRLNPVVEELQRMDRAAARTFNPAVEELQRISDRALARTRRRV